MSNGPVPLDLRKLKVYPLASRKSMAAIEDILVNPASTPPAPPNAFIRERIELCARQIKRARARDASVMFLYGAHLVKNGASAIVDRLMAGGWITHLATNGAGSIHDWEFAFRNWSTEASSRTSPPAPSAPGRTGHNLWRCSPGQATRVTASPLTLPRGGRRHTPALGGWKTSALRGWRSRRAAGRIAPPAGAAPRAAAPKVKRS
jgi:hypothetical protein